MREEDVAIGRFWRWWADAGRRAVVAGLVARDGEALAATVSAAVEAIDPALAWEFGTDGAGRHQFVVSGGGDPRLRAVTQRWADASPADDQFVYAPARLPEADIENIRAQFGGVAVDVADTRFQLFVDEEHWWVSVGVFHPVFAKLPDEEATQIAFLVLDWVLGEDWVGQWIGPIGVLTSPTNDLVDVADLRAVVTALAVRAPTDEWAMLSAETPDGPVLVSVRRPLQWLSAPLATQAVVVRREFRARADGLPVDGEHERLTADEETLGDSLQGDVELVATMTQGGARTLFLYSPPGAGLDAVAQWCRTVGAQFDVLEDPGWSAVADFR
uniref:DUF695 domain-containing protein n=1 Tax=Gordonia sp. B7-2 TaxID=3420932 RepID=UPI003D8EA36E